ncbi:hypothetical protein E3T55_18955 [Cryobacterium frigoriphilum]|uniref:Histidine kinase/HSP90-like ATPase domain-containing protein n=1 Tax=Cryobacterium frigoriphilum TaxID=1259150 RepID=A0A4R8ZTK0_9MICO|nr:hypothetical protein [Cryobacterium frigoriphilum]TFD45350.1 hypothetical protein E3T55_18955 [Cryobacterium frigoriphilum]
MPPVRSILIGVTTDAPEPPPQAPPRRPLSVGIAESGGASERTTRLLYRAIGIGGLFFAVMSVPPYLAQVHRPHMVAAVSAWILVVGIPVMVAVLAQRAPLRLLRTLAIVEASTYMFVLGFWMLVRAAPLGVVNDIPWILSLAGIAIVIVAIGSRSSVTWTYTLVACTMSGIVRGFTTNDPRPVLVGLESGLYLLLLMSIFVGLTLATRRRAISIDRAALVARETETGRAAEIARKRERLTIDALVHDSVLSTLLIAGLGRAERAAISRQAQASLAQLDALRHQTGPATVSGAEFGVRLVVLVTDLAPGATLRVDLAATATLPTDAATALLGAVGEALRNSLASAGGPQNRPVTRRVVLVSEGGGVQLFVHDDGVGFDPRAVTAGRLGIAQSILGRMTALPGGHAAVNSRPGRGVTVALAYTPGPGASVCPGVGEGSGSEGSVGEEGVSEDSLSEAADAPLPLPEPPALPVPPAPGALALSRGLPTLVAATKVRSPRLNPPAPTQPALGAPALSRGLPTLVAATKVRSPRLNPPAPTPPAPDPAPQPAQPGPDASAARPFAGLLGLSTAMTRAVLIFFVLLHLMFAVSNAHSWRTLTLELTSFVMVSFAAVWVTRPARDPLPVARTAVILGVCTLTTVLVFLRVPPQEPLPSAAFWHLGAIIVILLVMVGRGRPVWAWTTYVALVVISEIWAITSGLSSWAGLALLVHHAGLLAAGSFFVVQLRRHARALGGITREHLGRAAAEATLTAAVEEREAQFTRVNALSRAVLERIAGSRPFSDDDRAEFLLVEATLRDAVRGRCLFIEPVIEAARAARARGVEVSLIDDRGDAAGAPVPAALGAASFGTALSAAHAALEQHAVAAALESVARIVAAELDATPSGRFTARVLPAGRPHLATIVVDAFEQRMLLIAPDGTLR